MSRYWARLGMVGVFLLGAAGGVLGITLLHQGTHSLAHAQSAGCTNATLNGTYGVLLRGYTLTAADGSPLAAPLPHAAINVVTVDGAGNYSRTGTLNAGGTLSPNPATGTYSVNPDCSFTLSIALPNGGTAHVAGVLTDGGKRAYLITTDPGAVNDLVWERQ